MYELTINGQVVPFNFGMGFLREVNALVSAPVEGLAGVKQNIGLRYIVARLFDGDVEGLVEVLNIANKGCVPRITKAELDTFVEDGRTDIDEVFATVMGFLKTANATKKSAVDVIETMEKEKAKLEAVERMRLEAMM